VDPVKPTPPPLPFVAGEPLPLHPPGWELWPWLLALAVAALAWWLWRRWRARPPAAALAPAPAPAAAPAEGRKARGIAGRLFELEAFHLARKSYREGCHALAEALREWLEEETARGARAMTAEEIGRHLAQGGLPDLMLRLRDVRFAEAEPTEPVFLELFRSARRVIGHKGWKK
jgi:hypothetical protein